MEDSDRKAKINILKEELTLLGHIFFILTTMDGSMKGMLRMKQQLGRITYIGNAGIDNQDAICEASYPGMTDDICAGKYYMEMYRGGNKHE